MNMKKWAESLKETPFKKAMPVLSYPGAALLGISVGDLVRSSELQANCMKRVADEVDSLASVSLMDLSVEAEAFGAKVRFTTNEVPTVIGSLVEFTEDADELEVPGLDAARVPVYLEAIRQAKELITDRPVFAGVIGPFSLAGRLVGVTEAMVLGYEEPDMLHTVMRKCTDFLIEYIREYRVLGADGVVLAEPLTGMLSPQLAAEFSTPYVRELVEACETEEFLIIYHNCGSATLRMVDTILDTGCSVFHLGDAIDMKEALEKFPEEKIVMGNVSPAGEFVGGTPESVYQTTTKLLERCADHKNFVLSSGCDIPPHASWDNIRAFFRANEEYWSA